MSVRDGLEAAIAAADHLTPMDDAAIAAARALADKIDAWDVIVKWALEDTQGDGRPAVPANDNTSLGSFLKYCNELGLTPLARKTLDFKQEGKGGKLAQLRSVQGGKKTS